MTATTILKILALALAALLYAVPAHADTQTEPGAAPTRQTRSQGPSRWVTGQALDLLCGPGHGELAEHVDRAARRYMLSPVLIVAVMRVESRCRADAVSVAGARGHLQLLGRAAAGMTIEERHDPARNIDRGAKWLSALTVWCGSVPRGLGAYATGKCGKGHRYARAVLAAVRRAWRVLGQRQERAS